MMAVPSTKLKVKFEVVQGLDYGCFAVVSQEFPTEKEAQEFSQHLAYCLKLSDDLDRAQEEADALDQSKYLTVDTDIVSVESYNKLAELGNLKEMSPKEVLDMIIDNEVKDHVGPEMEAVC